MTFNSHRCLTSIFLQIYEPFTQCTKRPREGSDSDPQSNPSSTHGIYSRHNTSHSQYREYIGAALRPEHWFLVAEWGKIINSTLWIRPHTGRHAIPIEVFHEKLSMNLLNLMTKILQSKGFDPRISSAEGQCAGHYAMKPCVIVVICKCILVYASFFSEFVEMMVSVKLEKNSNVI